MNQYAKKGTPQKPSQIYSRPEGAYPKNLPNPRGTGEGHLSLV